MLRRGILLTLFILCWPGMCLADAVRVTVGVLGQRVTTSQEVQSAKEIKERNVVMQRLDYSCGSAALATLFNYYLGEPVAETEIINHILRTTKDLKKIMERRGFSLLDLKQYANSKGYKAEGYRMTLEDLIGWRTPVLVPIQLEEYKHFIIVRGVMSGRVFVADPSLGNTIMTVPRFNKVWVDNVALVITTKQDTNLGKYPLRLSKLDESYLEAQVMRQLLNPGMIDLFRSPLEF